MSVRETARLRTSTAPERIWLSVRATSAQIDLSLPLDVSVAQLIPSLLPMLGDADSARDERADARRPNSIWVLSTASGAPLDPGCSLREAGISAGELLRLEADQCLTAPTLFDDVVDAAARLNKTGFPTWDRVAAHRLALAAVISSSAAWVYLLLSGAFGADRAAGVGLALAASAIAVTIAVHADRSGGDRELVCVLGWSALPPVAAAAWVGLAGWDGWPRAAACALLAVGAACMGRLTGAGAGRGVDVAAASFFALAAAALAAAAAGVPSPPLALAAAVLATFGSLAVDGSIRRRPRRASTRARRASREAFAFANPFTSPPQPATEPLAGREIPHDGAALRAIQTGLHAGAAIAAVVGAVELEWSNGSSGPVVLFALVCAATLGLNGFRRRTVTEQWPLVLPAGILVIVSCVLAQRAQQPVALACFGVLVTLALMLAVAGIAASRGAIEGFRARAAAVVYANYLAAALIVPAAIYVVVAAHWWGAS